MKKGDLVKLYYASKDINPVAGIIVKEYIRGSTNYPRAPRQQAGKDPAWYVWWFDAPIHRSTPVLERSLVKLEAKNEDTST